MNKRSTGLGANKRTYSKPTVRARGDIERVTLQTCKGLGAGDGIILLTPDPISVGSCS